MKVLPKAKQVRYAQLVAAAGRPEVGTLWVSDPKEDATFRKAMEENRIVSVRVQNVGSKKDRGTIGFLKGPNLVYLIFPKALPMAEGTGVIGLKLDELDSAEAKPNGRSRTKRKTGKS